MVLLYDIYFPTSYLFYTKYCIIPIKYTMVCLYYRFKKNKKEVRRDAKKKGDEIQIVLKIYIFTNENNNNELQVKIYY